MAYANFDWVVLSTRRLIVVFFAKDVFLHDAEVNLKLIITGAK